MRANLLSIGNFITKLTETTCRHHRLNIEQYANGDWFVSILDDNDDVVNTDGCHCVANSNHLDQAVTWLAERLPV